jgi:hypothetical protein
MDNIFVAAKEERVEMPEYYRLKSLDLLCCF